MKKSAFKKKYPITAYIYIIINPKKNVNASYFTLVVIESITFLSIGNLFITSNKCRQYIIGFI